MVTNCLWIRSKTVYHSKELAFYYTLRSEKQKNTRYLAEKKTRIVPNIQTSRWTTRGNLKEVWFPSRRLSKQPFFTRKQSSNPRTIDGIIQSKSMGSHGLGGLLSLTFSMSTFLRNVISIVHFKTIKSHFALIPKNPWNSDFLRIGGFWSA